MRQPTTMKELVNNMSSLDKERAQKLYHFYQYMYLTTHNISISDFVEFLEERQISHKLRFHKELTVKEVFDNFDKNGLGNPGENPWCSLEQFYEIVYSDSDYMHRLIEAMPIKDEEKEKLYNWSEECYGEYEIMLDSNTDYSGDWLGPNADETWEDLYDKD